MRDEKIVDMLKAKSGKKGPRIIDPQKMYKVSGDLVITLREFTRYLSKTKDFTPYDAQMKNRLEHI